MGGRGHASILRQHDVRLVSTREVIDRQTPEGALQTGILAQFGQFEKAKIKARTKAGIGARARSGKPWGTPAYGYRKGPDGHWTPDPHEQAIAARLDRERVEHGLPYNAIATLLNREGVPTRTGGNWTATQVRKVLTSRYRLGEFWHDGEWHRDRTRRRSPRTRGSPPTRSPRRATATARLRWPQAPLHLFTHGLLRCIHCYEAMLPRSDSDTYRCRTRAQIKGDDGCIMPNLPRAEVDRQALELFERLFLDLDATREEFAADLNAHLEEVETQQQRAAREAAERAVQIARVERDYLAGDLTAATY